MNETSQIAKLLNNRIAFLKSRLGYIAFLIFFATIFVALKAIFGDFPFPKVSNYLIGPAIILLSYIFWMIFSRRWFFAPSYRQVVLSVNVKESNEKHYRNILSEIRGLILGAGLRKAIEIRDLSADFLTPDNAQKISQKRGWPIYLMAELVTWSVNGTATHEFRNIRIGGTFLKDDLTEVPLDKLVRSPQIAQLHRFIYVKGRLDLFLSTLLLLFPDIKWVIQEDNSRRGCIDTASDLFALGCYCIGTYTALYINCDRGVILLNILKKRYETQGEVEKATYVNNAIADTYGFWGSAFFNHEDWVNAENYYNKAIEVYDDSPDWWMMLCIAKEHLGKSDEFFSIVRKIEERYSANPMTWASIAYAAVRKGDLEKARSKYMEISRSRGAWKDELHWVWAGGMLEDKYEETGELMYLFGKGIFALIYGNKETGVKDLEEFISKATGRNEYLSTIDDCKLILRST